MNRAKKLMLSAVFLIIFSSHCFAENNIRYPKNLWKGIIAEATSDGEKGMLAVACCVRNRLSSGMNTGLCGLKRKDLDKFVFREGKLREKQAKEIIQKVFEENATDITLGATHFECVEKYGLPKWARGMKKLVKIGSHTFFKRR